MDDLGLRGGAWPLPVDWRGPDDRFRNDLRELPRYAQAAALLGLYRTGTWVLPEVDPGVTRAMIARQIHSAEPGNSTSIGWDASPGFSPIMAAGWAWKSSGRPPRERGRQPRLSPGIAISNSNLAHCAKGTRTWVCWSMPSTCLRRENRWRRVSCGVRIL